MTIWPKTALNCLLFGMNCRWIHLLKARNSKVFVSTPACRPSQSKSWKKRIRRKPSKTRRKSRGREPRRTSLSDLRNHWLEVEKCLRLKIFRSFQRHLPPVTSRRLHQRCWLQWRKVHHCHFCRNKSSAKRYGVSYIWRLCISKS